jgi:hypothetical protein
MPNDYSIWLLPAAAPAAKLNNNIALLSNHLGSPGFAPHVTIQGDITTELEPLGCLLERLAACQAPLRWRVEAVESSAHFFRCLYLRLALTPAFGLMQQATQAITRTETGLSPFPHLSLAYGEPQPHIAGLLGPLAAQYEGQELVFDELALCRSSKNVPINEWCILAHYPLSPA